MSTRRARVHPGLALLPFFCLLLEVRSAIASSDPVTGGPVPAAPITSLDGQSMDPAQARGRFLLLAFTDRESRDQGTSWLEEHLPRFLGRENLSLYNVIVPGGVFMVPRRSILDHVRKDVARIEAAIRESLAPPDRARLDALDIRWHVDFDRKVSKLFEVPAHQVSLILVDPAGTIVFREQEVSREAIDRVLDLVSESSMRPPR